jgi:hypothetical protein
MKVISTTVSYSQQDVNFIQYLDIGGHKVRIDIRSNAYKFQSHAKLEVLNKKEMKWNVVVSRPSGDMQTQEGLYVRKGCDAGLFEFDRKWLLNVFVELIKAS